MVDNSNWKSQKPEVGNQKLFAIIKADLTLDIFRTSVFGLLTQTDSNHYTLFLQYFVFLMIIQVRSPHPPFPLLPSEKGVMSSILIL